MKFTKDQIQEAREAVADFWIQNSQAIRTKDSYASHVTEEEKDIVLLNSLAYAEEIRTGKQDHNFTIAQRIHYHLTGESVALLPSYK